jgi:hypothetical protein
VNGSTDASLTTVEQSRNLVITKIVDSIQARSSARQPFSSPARAN